VEYPSFVARSADTLRGLWLTSAYAPELKGEVIRLVEKLLPFQYANGGFPNTVGYFMDTRRRHWQDACCSTRWNAYAFFLLCTLSAGSLSGVMDQRESRAEIRLELDEGYVFVETKDTVDLLSPQAQTAASIRKPSGEAAYVGEKWKGDLSGPRTARGMKR
jgi:hypothetical protein